MATSSAMSPWQRKQKPSCSEEKPGKMVDMGTGLEWLDVGSLNVDQLQNLLEFKINTKIANEKYLRSHKEVELLLSGFLREVLLQRPENIREFAADYFTNPELPKKIQQQMMEKINQAL